MLFVPTLVVAQCNAPVDRGDADGNGMVNHFEINVGTNPFSPDTDGDGLGDVYELNTGSNPLVNGNAPTPAPAPVGPAPAERPDADGDGLYDDDEWNVYGTDAGAYDTDGDGSGDGEEVYYGSGPLDPFCDPYGCG